MLKPIAPASGIAFAFPDVCQTPSPTGTVLLPYPNIANLADASPVTNQSCGEVKVGPDGLHILLKDTKVNASSGNESATAGTQSGVKQGACKIVEASASVVYGPQKAGLVRFMDKTEQNCSPTPAEIKNADGFILSSFPSVQVGD